MEIKSLKNINVYAGNKCRHERVKILTFPDKFAKLLWRKPLDLKDQEWVIPWIRWFNADLESMNFGRQWRRQTISVGVTVSFCFACEMRAASDL